MRLGRKRDRYKQPSEDQNPIAPRRLPPTKTKHEFPNSRNPGQIDRVKVEWKVGGEVIDVVDKKEHREKLSVVCNLDYEEKTLQVPTKAQDLSTSLRYYHQAEAAEKIGERHSSLFFDPMQFNCRSYFIAKAAYCFVPAGA